MLFIQSIYYYLSSYNYLTSQPQLQITTTPNLRTNAINNVETTSNFKFKPQYNSSFYPLAPPAIPLAVRSPYVNILLPSHYLPGTSVRHWPNNHPNSSDKDYEMGWNGLIMIDGTVFQFLGDDNGSLNNANQTSFTYTATTSVFNFIAKGVEFEVRFLSPVTPLDLKRLSIPLAYMEVKVDPNVLKKHSVKVYADTNGQWASGDSNSEIEWSYDVEAAVGIYAVYRKHQKEFEEYREQAEAGSAVHAVSLSYKVTTQSGIAREVRDEFYRKGKLNGTQDVDYRKINDRSAVFAFAKELTKEDSSIVFTVGHMRVNYISYITPRGQVSLKGYWTKFFNSAHEAVRFFVKDYPSAMFESLLFDSNLRRDARLASGSNYSAIVELSTRQSFATFELTEHSQDENGVMGFLKEISSNGDCSTVDVIFPLHPILIYTNPTLIKILLEPLMVYSASGMYPNKWLVHDLGFYPVARGFNKGDDEKMPVEETGNMLWMVLAYLQLTNDVEWVSKYYYLLTQWTTFLISDGLIPDSQLSTDDFAGTLSNQTNLAMKAIVGIGAAGQIAKLTNHFSDFIHFEATAKAYAREWLDLALVLSSDFKHPHSKLSYQDEQSWGLLYNLFGDRLLNLNLFNDELYQIQSEFYVTKQEEFGVPLDSRHMWSKTDWEMFCSASATSVETRDMFIDLLVAYLKAGKVDSSFPDLYETESGDFPGRNGKEWNIEFISRPVVGGHFSLLALQVLNKANGVRRDPFRRKRYDQIEPLIEQNSKLLGGGLYFSKDV